MIICCVVAAVLFVWFLWISRGTEDADPNTIKYRLNRAWRRLAFWAGDVRLDWQWYFGIVPLPLISWVHYEPAISIEDILKVCKKLKKGDVMLATKFGYVFSNAAIPGCFKHAGIITNNGADSSETVLVEAISEGVTARHPLYARGDRMIFLRPKGMTDNDRNRAADLANRFIGCKYDADFKFNITEELSLFVKSPDTHGSSVRTSNWTISPHVEISDDEIQESHLELERIVKNHMAEYDIAFSCTETVAAAWWFRRKRLGIFRKPVRGRLCIIADQFVNRDFYVVWTNVTVDEANKAGLSEEGVREIEHYWEKSKRGIEENEKDW